VGDLGILAARLKCRDAAAFRKELSAKWKDCSDLGTLPDGTPFFWVKDLYGNWFQAVERKDVFIDEKRLAGGLVGAVIGVSDMDCSVRFYADILGYTRVLSDTEGPYDTTGFLPGGGRRCRRVVLGHEPRRGAFSAMFGESALELVQALDYTPRKVYEGRFWGDPGFIQVCFDVTKMDELKAFCAAHGHPFTVDSCPDGERFDMGDASGRFTYIEDPDGTLIEFVETYKIPVAKKLGWFIDMEKRDPAKPLPKFLFRMMGLVSRQKLVA
jgi:catechol 2,3-dioxygenase-like lactoylglutathione lyase family enzyme